MKAEKITQRVIVISTILSGIVLSLYAILGTHIRMIVDDYCSAFRGLDYGPIEGVFYRYQTWASEYTNFFIKYSLAPLQPEIHPWIGVFTLIVFLLSTAYLISQIFDYFKFPDKKKYLLPATIIFTFTFYRLMPSYQHAFWFAAVIPYTWAIIVAIFFSGTVLQYFSKPRTSPNLIFFLIWTVFIVLILGGFVSIMITSFGMAFVLLLLMTLRRYGLSQRDYLSFVMTGGFAVFIGLIITILSPGVALRRAAIVSSGEIELLSPLQALPDGLVYTLSYIFGEPFGVTFGQTYAIAFLGSLFCLLFLWGIFYLEANKNYAFPAPKSLRMPFLISNLVMFLLIFSVIYPATYAASGVLPMRPLILPRLIQLITVIYWAYLAIVYAQRTKLLEKLRQAKTWGLVLSMVSILLIWSPLVSIYKLVVLYPDYQAYSQSWDERHDLLSNANPDEIVVVPQLAYDIEDNFVLEKLDTNPSFWINTCVANFYDVAGVSEIPEEE